LLRANLHWSGFSDILGPMTGENYAETLINRVRLALLDCRVATPGSGIVVAVSGGPDSTALVHVLKALTNQMDFRIVAAHLDHKLRTDSHQDVRFVNQLAQELGIEFFSREADVQALAAVSGISVEEAGRRARYTFLEEVRSAAAAQWIATGHHLDDAFETFFLRLFRGSSLQGLRGIEPIRGHIVRPFIGLRREEILRYLDDRGICYRTDPTNLSSDTDRNFVRNQLLPVVRERFPGFANPLKRTLDLVRQENELLEDLGLKVCSEAIVTGDGRAIVNVPILRATSRPLAGRAILAALYQVSGAEARWGRVHVRIVEGILQSTNPSARAFLPGGIVVKRQYDELIIERHQDRASKEYPAVIVTKPGQVAFPGTDTSFEFRIINAGDELPIHLDRTFSAYFDADHVTFPLALRVFRPGDSMRAWGTGGTRKVKKIFIDARVPRDLRHAWPLLVKNDEIIWIPGLRRGQAAPILLETSRILEVRLVGGKEPFVGYVPDPRRGEKSCPKSRRGAVASDSGWSPGQALIRARITD